MPHKKFIEDRLELLEIDADVVSELRRARRYIEPELETMLERFYAHIMSTPGLKALFADRAAVDRARRAQKSHWVDRLFAGRFDSDYFDQAERIGNSHARIGLSPSDYIAGYSHMLAQFVAAIADECRSGGTDPKPPIQAVCKAALLDLDLVIHCYLEAKDDNMRQILRRATGFAADMIDLNAQLSLANQAVQETAARLQANGSVATDDLPTLLEEIDALAEQTRLVNERVAAMQTHDKLYIENSPGDTGTFARLRALFRGR
jgi:methyl-accepting chemotaxis protein